MNGSIINLEAVYYIAWNNLNNTWHSFMHASSLAHKEYGPARKRGGCWTQYSLQGFGWTYCCVQDNIIKNWWVGTYTPAINLARFSVEWSNSDAYHQTPENIMVRDWGCWAFSWRFSGAIFAMVTRMWVDPSQQQALWMNLICFFFCTFVRLWHMALFISTPDLILLLNSRIHNSVISTINSSSSWS